ncbi:hypothetical protein pb186bvf_016664 [Paramecium bursaria]
MLQQDYANLSKQVIKQDHELSQFIKHLEIQKSFQEKNKQLIEKQEQKKRQIEGKRQEERFKKFEQSQMKQLELSMIKESFEKSLITKKEQLSRRLENQDTRHRQIIQQRTQDMNEKSLLRGLYLQDQVEKARQYTTDYLNNRKDRFQQKLQQMDIQIQQKQNQRSIERQEKSVLFNCKLINNQMNYSKSQELLKEKINVYENKLENKDSLSRQILLENERKIQEKLQLQQASLSIGLRNADKAQQNFQNHLQYKEEKIYKKMDKLDQMIKERELLQQQARERRAMVENQKYLLKVQHR